MLEVCGRVLAHSVRHLADSVLLPHDMEAYARKMQNGIQDLK